MFGRLRCRRAAFALLLLAAGACRSATAPAERQGLAVVDSLAEYREQVRRDADKELVDLRVAVPAVVVEMPYATSDNFLHRQLYPAAGRRNRARATG